MNDSEEQKLPMLKDQISDELTTDDLEQVSGGVAPLLAIGAGIAVRYVAKKVITGVIRGAINEENDERNRAQQGCTT